MIPLKQLLLICAVVALVGCGKSKEEQEFSDFMAAAEAKTAELQKALPKCNIASNPTK